MNSFNAPPSNFEQHPNGGRGGADLPHVLNTCGKPWLLLSCLCWCSYLLIGIVREATKTDMQALLVLHLLLESLDHHQNIASSSLSIGITLVDVNLNWLNWFHFLILEGGLLLILIDCMIFLSPFLDITRMSMSTVFSSSHSYTLEFSAYRMLTFDLWSKWL